MDESIALLELSKDGRSACVEKVAYAHIQFGLKFFSLGARTLSEHERRLPSRLQRALGLLRPPAAPRTAYQEGGTRLRGTANVEIEDVPHRHDGAFREASSARFENSARVGTCDRPRLRGTTHCHSSAKSLLRFVQPCPREPRVHVCSGRARAYEVTEGHVLETQEGRLRRGAPSLCAYHRRGYGGREGAQVAHAPSRSLASDVRDVAVRTGADANTRGASAARGSSHPQTRQDQLLCAAAHGASVAVAAKAWLSGHGLARAARTVESGPECFRARQQRLARPPGGGARQLPAGPHRFTRWYR